MRDKQVAGVFVGIRISWLNDGHPCQETRYVSTTKSAVTRLLAGMNPEAELPVGTGAYGAKLIRVYINHPL